MQNHRDVIAVEFDINYGAIKDVQLTATFPLYFTSATPDRKRNDWPTDMTP